MLTQDNRRWPVGQLNTPLRTGKVPDFDRFDASFFAVHGQQAQVALCLHLFCKAAAIALLLVTMSSPGPLLATS